MKYIFIFIMFFALLFNSCKDPCDFSESAIFFDYILSFRLVDENNKTVIADYRAKYLTDDVRLETDEGELLPWTDRWTNITGGGGISFRPTSGEDDGELANRDIEQNFFLFLPDTSYVGGFDVDTLQIRFRAETCDIGSGCCAGFEYERFEITYNNKEPHHRDDGGDSYKFYLFRK